jgi:hypothetical protein
MNRRNRKTPQTTARYLNPHEVPEMAKTIVPATAGLADIIPGEQYSLEQVQVILGYGYDAIHRRLKKAGIVPIKNGGMGHPRLYGSQILELVGRSIIDNPPETETEAERLKRSKAAMDRIASK